MSELMERILRVLHQNHQIADVVGMARIGNLLDYQFHPHDYDKAMRELASMGYVAARPGAMWAILAFDKSMSCAVCGKYAPKTCPGCKHVFCGEHYGAHVESNFTAAERMLDKVKGEQG